MHPLTSHYLATERSLELQRRAEAARRARSGSVARPSYSAAALRAVGGALVAAGEALTRAGTPSEISCVERPRTA